MKESSSDPANYTGKTLSDDQKLKLLTVKFSFPHGFKFPTAAGGVSNYHGWRNGHGCVTALEMTQLAVFVVYVCPTILVQMNRHLSQRISKTGRTQVLSALTPKHAVKDTNFQRKR